MTAWKKEALPLKSETTNEREGDIYWLIMQTYFVTYKPNIVSYFSEHV